MGLTPIRIRWGGASGGNGSNELRIRVCGHDVPPSCSRISIRGRSGGVRVRVVIGAVVPSGDRLIDKPSDARRVVGTIQVVRYQLRGSGSKTSGVPIDDLGKPEGVRDL